MTRCPARSRARIAALAASLSLPLLAASVPARAVPVALELALAVDVSGSTDASEFALMIEGYASAFESQAVQDAIAARGQIAVLVYFWASDGATGLQEVKVPWTAVAAADADAFAASLRTLLDPLTELEYGGFVFPFDPPLLEPFFLIPTGPMSFSLAGGNGEGSGQTAVAQAIDFGRERLLEDNGFESSRRVLDVSGDGHENVDFDPAGCASCTLGVIVNPIVGPGSPITDRDTYFRFTSDARDAAVAAGVVVNGVAIATDVADLDDHFYAEQVIGGDGSFVVRAEGFDSFGQAITQKITQEISAPEPAPPWLFAIGAFVLAGGVRLRGGASRSG